MQTVPDRFTGSAGIAVVTMKEACLWVDGR